MLYGSPCKWTLSQFLLVLKYINMCTFICSNSEIQFYAYVKFYNFILLLLRLIDDLINKQRMFKHECMTFYRTEK